MVTYQTPHADSVPPTGAPHTNLVIRAGQSHRVRMEAGQHYQIRRVIPATEPPALEVPDNLIATRQADALHLRYADGSTVTLEDFYRVCTSDAVCSVNLVSDSEAGITLGAGTAGNGVSGAEGNLSASTNNTGDNGNLHGLVSSYTGTDGVVHELADVWFQQGAQFTLDTDANGLNFLHLAANAPALDVTTLDTTRLRGLTVIDLLSDQTADTLRLDVQQVLDLGGVNAVNANSSGLTGGSYHFAADEARHQLVVTGDAADTLAATGGFVDTGLTAILNGHTYEVYNQGNNAQLLVELGINRTAVM